MLLVSFTGAQSTGKSTLLELCKEFLFPDPEWSAYGGHDSECKWKFIPEVTRLIKRQYGVSINESGTDDTQLLILNQHLINTLTFKQQMHEERGHYMMDRCIMDGLVYSKYLHNHGRLEDATMTIAESMYQRLLPSLDAIFYTHPEDIPIHDDGERSVDPDFRNEIIEIYDSLISSGYYGVGSNFHVLKGTPENRLTVIMKTLRELGGI